MPKFHVQRSIEIATDPQTVFDMVSDFSTWTTWSPWLCCEPDATVTVSDDPKSVGSTYAWEGTVVGAGEMEHQHLEAPHRIESEIRFLKPWKSQSKVSFDVQPSAVRTQLTWHMEGSMPWFMFWMIPQMDIYIGMDYERGLKMLKERLETGELLTKTQVIGIESVGPLTMLGVRRSCAFKEIGPVMQAAFSEARQKFESHGLSIEGEGLSVYHKTDMKRKIFDFTSGFAASSLPDREIDGLTSWSLPQTQALRVTHIGKYEHLGNAWTAGYMHVRYKKLKQLKKLGDFEIYRNDCETTSESELLTDIYLPLK